jgi:hypothetical protein
MTVSPAMAAVSWVQTPFWQTVFETNYSIALQNTNTEIAGECRDFQKWTYDDQGVLKVTDASAFQGYNRLGLPSDMIHSDFYLEMKLGIAPNLILADLSASSPNLATAAQEKAKTDVLPGYTQAPAQIALAPESFQLPLRIEKQPQSLSAAGEKLGVLPGALKIISHTDGYYLVLTSKDIACDLLSHHADLAQKAKASVKIALNKVVELGNFYDKIQDISTAALDKSSSPQIRAALLGFRLGGFLSQSGTPEKVESQLLQILTQFFEIENMSPNKNWSDAFGKKILDVPGMSPNVDINIQILGPK